MSSKESPGQKSLSCLHLCKPMEDSTASETERLRRRSLALEEECRQVRYALWESEARYLRISLAVTDYIFTVTVDHGQAVRTEHGPACVAVTGYTVYEFAGDPNLWYWMVVEEDRPAVLMQAEQILSGRDPGPIEHRILRKDGAIRWVSNTPVLQFDKKGMLVSYDGLIRDITVRKQAEAEREKLIAELQDALTRVKILSGLLPICSNCKKVRDDSGYWTQIELYIQEHSGAEFSHGICPDCAKVLYPGYYQRTGGSGPNGSGQGKADKG